LSLLQRGWRPAKRAVSCLYWLKPCLRFSDDTDPTCSRLREAEVGTCIASQSHKIYNQLRRHWRQEGDHFTVAQLWGGPGCNGRDSAPRLFRSSLKIEWARFGLGKAMITVWLNIYPSSTGHLIIDNYLVVEMDRPSNPREKLWLSCILCHEKVDTDVQITGMWIACVPYEKKTP
jgi:hypothetical protein